MNMIIDVRETELIKLVKYFLENNANYKDIQLKIETLPIGDIIFKQIDGEQECEKLIIERKSLSDLASSIKDGRYDEQSYRLNGLNHHNHNIIYLIEGDVNRISLNKNKMDKMTLYSAMFSLNYVKGFSVLRTFNMDESALMLCQMAYKMSKLEMENKKAYYKDIADETGNAISDEPDITNVLCSGKGDEYCSVIKKVKKENITPENIGEIILCQIPGISSVSAIAIMSIYKTLPNLIKHIQESDICLNDITYENSKNQKRKVNKTAIAHIYKYLKT